MPAYTVRIDADKGNYPVLLSNRNFVASGDLPEGRHFTVWEEPLSNALLPVCTGNLAMPEDSFTTVSGNEDTLCMYAEHKDIAMVPWAMPSLKQAMKYFSQSEY